MVTIAVLRCTIVVLSLIGTTVPVSRAEDPENIRTAPADVRESARALFDGVVRSREQIRTCSYRARVIRTFDGHPNLPAPQHAEVFGAFDLATHRVRFDFDGGLASPHESGRYITTPTEAWLYTESHSGQLASGTLRHLPSGELPPGTLFRVVDVRTIGLNLMQDLERGTSFLDLAKVYTREPGAVRAVVSEPNGISRIDYRADKNGFVNISLWVDEVRALPLRVEMRYWDVEKQVWGDVESASETDWMRVSGIWVPKKHVARDTKRNRDGSKWTDKLEFTFEWHSVNEPVDEVLFDPIGGLKPIEGTRVIDLRPAQPVIEKTIGTKR